MSELKIQNYDALIPGDGLEDDSHELFFKRPFFAIFVGKAGSGKTNTLLNCLMNGWFSYNNLLYFGKNSNDPKLQLLEAFCEEKKKADKTFTYLISSDFNEIPDPTELDPKRINVICFDDFLLSKAANEVIQNYAIYGRAGGCCTFYLTQDYYQTARQLRENANYVCLWSPLNTRKIGEYYLTFGDGMDRNEWKRLFLRATKTKHDFFLVDLKTRDPDLRFRHNFDPFE